MEPVFLLDTSISTLLFKDLARKLSYRLGKKDPNSCTSGNYLPVQPRSGNT